MVYGSSDYWICNDNSELLLIISSRLQVNMITFSSANDNVFISL